MSLPLPYAFKLTQGCKLTRKITWQAGPSLMDFTGCTGKLLIHPGDEASPLITTTSSDNGIIVLGTPAGGNQGQMVFTFEPECQFAICVGRTDYFFTVTFTDGEPRPVLAGTLFLSRGNPYNA